MNKSINLQNFLDFYRDFISIHTYTNTKHEKKILLDKYLSGIESIRINAQANSEYNYCNRSYSFTIYNVPENKLGKLYHYRGSQVFMISKSSGGGGWGKYWNEIYKLDQVVQESTLLELKNEFQNNFVLRL
jgi:hypothetical protein